MLGSITLWHGGRENYKTPKHASDLFVAHVCVILVIILCVWSSGRLEILQSILPGFESHPGQLYVVALPS